MKKLEVPILIWVTCADFGTFKYVCGDTETSGHGWSNTDASENGHDESSCVNFCEEQGAGCCEFRGTWCLYKADGVVRYSSDHTTAKATYCESSGTYLSC
jgi:hypothetical protein